MSDRWQKGELRDFVAEISSGKSVNSTDKSAAHDEKGVLKTSCVYNGRFSPEENKKIVDGESHLAKCPVKKGTTIVSRMNTASLVGASAYVEKDYPNLFLPDRLWSVRAKPTIDPRWLSFVIASPSVRRRLSDTASGTSASMKNISQDAFLSTPVGAPPLDEQRMISNILATWDEAIERLSESMALKNRRMEGLRQSLLGNRQHHALWKYQRLSEISNRVRRRNDGKDHAVMTISAKAGFLKQSEKFSRDMAGRSVDKYTLLKRGEFAYNKGNSLTSPYGCIFALQEQTALVPFVYYCFALKQGYHHQFYNHLFAAGSLNYQLSRLINSGVRNDGLLNLDVEDFFSCEVPAPPLSEQKQIAAVLDTARAEIELVGRELELLILQKRGLMQKLLTGEWRLNSSKEVA